jgi:hypothetical protein
MRTQRKSFRRKEFRRRKGSCDKEKKKKSEQLDGYGAQKENPKETEGQWFWLSEEMADQGCRRLDRRQRRLNSELLRAVEEGAAEKVAR